MSDKTVGASFLEKITPIDWSKLESNEEVGRQLREIVRLSGAYLMSNYPAEDVKRTISDAIAKSGFPSTFTLGVLVKDEQVMIQGMAWSPLPSLSEDQADIVSF